MDPNKITKDDIRQLLKEGKPLEAVLLRERYALQQKRDRIKSDCFTPKLKKLNRSLKYSLLPEEKKEIIRARNRVYYYRNQAKICKQKKDKRSGNATEINK